MIIDNPTREPELQAHLDTLACELFGLTPQERQAISQLSAGL